MNALDGILTDHIFQLHGLMKGDREAQSIQHGAGSSPAEAAAAADMPRISFGRYLGKLVQPAAAASRHAPAISPRTSEAAEANHGEAVWNSERSRMRATSDATFTGVHPSTSGSLPVETDDHQERRTHRQQTNNSSGQSASEATEAQPDVHSQGHFEATPEGAESLDG
eukprot:CAMPEP_0170339032 /NCGR_PEP_ID=MMETSP0116_2-20130129/70568_1 /TAXON_ID=400756 /ORGANISM="Durinskia baltica, Strain CSIRO CS-38" /LENGTH=167 /DNA_ID=CAMNT_0010592439 /DNA_START=56 /DNA_END=557 /DNA_ORIENTATION=-